MSWTAKDLMRRGIAVVEASATMDELERAFAEAKVSGFPVVAGGAVVGVISRSDVLERFGGGSASGPSSVASTYYGDVAAPSRDSVATIDELAARAGRRTDELRVEDLMTRTVISVSPDDSYEAVAQTLTSHHVHRALVIDGGQLVGIVSSLDLVALIARERLRPTS